MRAPDRLSRGLKKTAQHLGIKEKPSEIPSGRVRFVVFDGRISIKDDSGGMVTYKLDFLRGKVARAERDGIDMSLEKKALAAYDEHLATQRRKVEAALNKRANRIKSIAANRRV